MCLVRAVSHSFQFQLSLIIYASEKKTYVYFLAQIRAFLFNALRHTSSQLTIPGESKFEAVKLNQLQRSSL